MKRVAVLVVAVFILAVGIPVFAEMTPEQKNQCLLASKGCKGEVDTIQQKIRKLNNEIKKGNKVYSDADIKKLNAKLKEAEDMLDEMLRSGGP